MDASSSNVVVAPGRAEPLEPGINPSKLPRKPRAPHPNRNAASSSSSSSLATANTSTHLTASANGSASLKATAISNTDTNTHTNITSSSSIVLQQHVRQGRRKLHPPLPVPPRSSHPSSAVHPSGAAPSLGIKTMQGRGTRRTDSTHPGFGREVVFVTRKTGLGMLIGRCRALVLDEGYTKLTLYALGAAIPQALLLLHAVLDVLPYPLGKRGMWYEIRTGSVECVDEVDRADGDKEEFGGLGDVEEAVPDKVVRMKSSIQIELNISPRPDPSSAKAKRPTSANDQSDEQEKPRKRNRPSKERRLKLRQRALEAATGLDASAGLVGEDAGQDMDEEEMMNAANGTVLARSDVQGAGGSGHVASDEIDEEVEEIEMR